MGEMQRLEIVVFGAVAEADPDPAGLVVIRVSLQKRERSRALHDARALPSAAEVPLKLGMSYPGRNSPFGVTCPQWGRMDADVALLLAHIGLRLPKGSQLVENAVEKTNG